VLEALKERGEIITKIAYANWGKLENSTRQLSEYAVQMVQRDPSPRGDKNGADINLALDALELAFTHDHINAFAIVSGDSDFIALVNKLKQYDKTVFVVGGKAFTSTILQKNCHEFISYESMLDDSRSSRPPQPRTIRSSSAAEAGAIATTGAAAGPPSSHANSAREPASSRSAASARSRSASGHAAGGARPAGAGAPRSAAAAGIAEIHHAAARFQLQRTRLRRGLVHRFHRESCASRTDSGDRRRRPLHDPAQAEMEEGVRGRRTGWVGEARASPTFDWKQYGFQEFSELLNYAQDKTGGARHCRMKTRG
jgi:uncharacterized protein (TIGR00288 family)